MNDDELESLLYKVSLREPGPGFLEAGLARLRRPRTRPWIHATWALAAGLTLSAALNLYFYTVHSNDPAKSDGSSLLLSVSQSALLVSAGSPAMKFLCLIRTPVIVDDNFQLGELNGFGEWVSLEIASFFDISFSLVPLHDWQNIGSYSEGTVEIALPDDHLLKVSGVGLGPQGVRNGGPLPVYGRVVPSRLNGGNVNTNAAQNSNRYAAAIQNNLNLASGSNPFRNQWRITTGFDTALSPTLVQTLSPYLDNNRCG